MARTALDLLELDPSAFLWRIYKRAGRYPTEWRAMCDTGPLSGGRFDHHIPTATHSWAAAIYDAYPNVCGLAYNSAMTGQPRAVVLFDRAQSALPAAPLFNRPLNDPTLKPGLAACANAVGYEFR